MHASSRTWLRAAALCACAVAPWLAQAQTPAVAPAMKVLDAGRSVCGGVGSDESEAMRAAMMHRAQREGGRVAFGLSPAGMARMGLS